MNITSASNHSIIELRSIELNAVRKNLNIQLLSKFVSYSFSSLLFLFAFVFISRAKIEGDKYLILMLVGMLKSPIEKLIFSGVLMV